MEYATVDEALAAGLGGHGAGDLALRTPCPNGCGAVTLGHDIVGFADGRAILECPPEDERVRILEVALSAPRPGEAGSRRPRGGDSG